VELDGLVVVDVYARLLLLKEDTVFLEGLEVQ
jgi:hypothetical protein